MGGKDPGFILLSHRDEQTVAVCDRFTNRIEHNILSALHVMSFLHIRILLVTHK